MTKDKEAQWVIDVTQWRVKHLRQWQEAVSSMSYDTLFNILSTAIVSWPFEELDPALPASYDELTLPDMTDAVRKVSEAIAGLFQR